MNNFGIKIINFQILAFNGLTAIAMEIAKTPLSWFPWQP